MLVKERLQDIIPGIIEKLKTAFQPKKIILFGSYAYGEPDEGSDIDLLVITEKRLSRQETSTIRREFFKDWAVTLQIVSISEEEFLETKDVIGGVTYPAAKYGEVLYEKS